MTFDSEGNDDSDSRYYSRVIHWPGDASGVTIGRGYDMKYRTGDEIYSDLTAAGVANATAEILRGASGLELEEASDWVKDNKTNVGVISAEAQHKLFEVVYAEYEQKTKRLATKDDVTAAYGETDWDNTNGAIKELLVDLRYRGDYKPSTRKWIQEHVANNDLAKMTEIMSDERWKTEFGVPTDRFNRRKAFMDNALIEFNNSEENTTEADLEKIKKTDDSAPDKKEAKTQELAKVHLYSSKDTSFSSSRWINKDGSKTKYAESFETKIAIELKKEFGKTITHEQVLALIESEKADGNEAKAEEYRIKLFKANQYAIVETLNVDQKTKDGSTTGKNAMGRSFRSANNHEMYAKTKTVKNKKTKNQTYCNIYAYDVVTAMGGYIPRVWWDKAYEKKAISALENGTSFDTKAVYGQDITHEMNANSLTEWMHDIGDKYYGWDKADMNTAQAAANNGQIAIILAKKKDGSSGHVNVIMAERDQLAAQRNSEGIVEKPLQSQAGGSNFKHKVHSSKWWAGSSYEKGGAWVFNGTVESQLMGPQEMGIADAKAPTPSTESESTTVPTSKNPVVAPVTTTDNKTVEYTVQSGDTIKSIAQKFGITEESLKAINKVHEFKTKSGRVVEGFLSGQGLIIPNPTKTPKKEQPKKPTKEQPTKEKPVTKDPVKPLPDEDTDDELIDQCCIDLYKAMYESGYGTGVGTDEEGIYTALRRLNKDQTLIDVLKATYEAKYSRTLVSDLKSELSDTWLFGPQLTKALELLNETGKSPEKDKDKGGDKEEGGEKDKDKHIPGDLDVSITGSVGKKGDNIAEDVLKIQKFFVAFGYLESSNAEVSATKTKVSEDPTQAIPNDQLTDTIAAIFKYQKEAIPSSRTTKGDGTINAGLGTNKHMAVTAEVYNEYHDQELQSEIPNVLTGDQWVTQFRFGANFKNKEDQLEKDYIDFVEEKTGLSDPVDLHTAEASKIQEVKDQYGTHSWKDTESVKTNALRMSDKARDSKPNQVCCFDAAKKMMSNSGTSLVTDSVDKRIQTAVQDSSTTNKATNQANIGQKYIDAQLVAGKAVFVGVDYKERDINEGTTDHFIVIVGKHTDDKGSYYNFYNPGSSNASSGKSLQSNRLYVDGNKVGKKLDKGRYDLSQIRLNE